MCRITKQRYSKIMIECSQVTKNWGDQVTEKYVINKRTLQTEVARLTDRIQQKSETNCNQTVCENNHQIV